MLFASQREKELMMIRGKPVLKPSNELWQVVARGSHRRLPTQVPQPT